MFPARVSEANVPARISPAAPIVGPACWRATAKPKPHREHQVPGRHQAAQQQHEDDQDDERSDGEHHRIVVVDRPLDVSEHRSRPADQCVRGLQFRFVRSDVRRGQRHKGEDSWPGLLMAANRAAFGSRRHAFEGQKTRGPSSETTAGTSVSPAISVTATAIASVGPSERSTLSVDSSSAEKRDDDHPGRRGDHLAHPRDRARHRLLGVLHRRGSRSR